MLSTRSIRIFFLGISTLNIGLALIAFFMYAPLREMERSTGYILNVEVILLIYILTGFIIGYSRWTPSAELIRTGFYFGMSAALIEMIHITLENSGQLGSAESAVTGIFMLTLFAVFLVAGYYHEKKYKRINVPILQGIWIGAICMLVVSFFGITQLFWAYNSIRQHDVGSPDFIRTGWADFDAFVIADILEAAFKVLLMGPVMGAFFGLLGALLAKAISKRRS